METINLSELGINKQVLKRKFENDGYDDDYIKSLLESRTTTYKIKDAKKLISILYNECDKEKFYSKEPLSSYYAKKNKEKFDMYNDLLELSQKNDTQSILTKDIKNLVSYTENNILSYDELFENFTKISHKYHLSINQIEKMFYNENKF
ncbi:hypothetical protein M0Q50_03035 [bacterium]|jgi:hypothetical protein|nr:hypothetical protein [bacterium]